MNQVALKATEPITEVRRTTGVLIYYLQNLVDHIFRFYDLVAGGYFKCPHHDLHLMNTVLNEQFDWAMAQYNLSSASPIDFKNPFREFDLDHVCEKWFPEVRPRFQLLKFRIETTVADFSDNKLPNEFHLFLNRIGIKLTIYETFRNKHDADVFNGMLRASEGSKREFSNYNFDYVKDPIVKISLISYYEELKNIYPTESIRASIILCGAMTEALIIEALKLDEVTSLATYKRLKGASAGDINALKFNELIEVALEMKVIPKDIITQIDMVRNFRNFVHINKAVRSGFQVDGHIKEICKNTLFLVIKMTKEWIEKP